MYNADYPYHFGSAPTSSTPSSPSIILHPSIGGAVSVDSRPVSSTTLILNPNLGGGQITSDGRHQSSSPYSANYAPPSSTYSTAHPPTSTPSSSAPPGVPPPTSSSAHHYSWEDMAEETGKLLGLAGGVETAVQGAWGAVEASAGAFAGGEAGLAGFGAEIIGSAATTSTGYAGLTAFTELGGVIGTEAAVGIGFGAAVALPVAAFAALAFAGYELYEYSERRDAELGNTRFNTRNIIGRAAGLSPP